MKPSDRVVVIGAGGLLGSAFLEALRDGPALLTLGRGDLTAAIPTDALERIRAFSPTMVINCAADTNVETAEDRPLEVFRTNALLPGLLARACRRANAKFVHFSSTGCYGGWKSEPYNDFDRLEPTTVHHRAKLEGEHEVQLSGADHLILRVGWLFGGLAQRDFVHARIREASGKAEIASDPSQVGCPTFAMDVVFQTEALLEHDLSGVFNCVALEPVSRFTYVRRILDIVGSSTRLIPKVFVRRAPVSPNESALNTKLELLGVNRMRPWHVGLAEYLSLDAAGSD